MQIRTNDDTEDDIRSEPLHEPSDLITDEDVLSEGRIEADGDDARDRDEDAALFPGLPGPVIAAATFVPTFLALFFGLSYLVGTRIGPVASAPAPSAVKLMPGMGAPGTPPASEAPRDPFVPPRMFDPPSTRPSDPREVTPPSEAREVPRRPSPENTPSPPVEATAPRPSPTLPPTLPPAPPRASRPDPPQPQAAVLKTTPQRTPAPEPRTSGGEWTPAAAFADREAAGRLASSIQQQGYPVEIRQEQSSTRPWVVWISAQPRGGDRRR